MSESTEKVNERSGPVAIGIDVGSTTVKAVVVDPESPAAIREGLARVLGDAVLADDLRRRGRERAAAFSWERTAELTAQAYRRTA